MRVLIYCRVSTREQGASGLGIEAQKKRCIEEVQARGWSIGLIVEEVQSAGKKRPELDKALRLLDVKACDALMVSRLDRLSRSVGEFGKFVERSQAGDWPLVVLDPSIDLSTASGRMCANIVASVAQWEREMGSQRTIEGLERARARGTFTPTPPYSDRPTIRRIIRLREEQGLAKIAIARWLTEHGVPAPNGGPTWNHRSVGNILKREGVE
jgi:DNA invertase Pin-like site-specific DNA recombinase